MKIKVFEVRDECLEPSEIEDLVNRKLEELSIEASDVVSIMQPSGYAVTRVFYRK